MPRKARIDMSGALHHLMIRGIERRKIFRDDQDRDNLLDRLGKILVETKTPCYAWVRELGMRETEIARGLKITQPGVSVSVRRGEQIAREKGLAILGE